MHRELSNQQQQLRFRNEINVKNKENKKKTKNKIQKETVLTKCTSLARLPAKFQDVSPFHCEFLHRYARFSAQSIISHRPQRSVGLNGEQSAKALTAFVCCLCLCVCLFAYDGRGERLQFVVLKRVLANSQLSRSTKPKKKKL